MTKPESPNRSKRPALRNMLKPAALGSENYEEDCVLAELARLAGFGTYTLNPSSGACTCSASLRSILRIEMSESAHTGFEKGIDQSHREEMAASLTRLLTTGGEDFFEHEYCAPDGTTLTLRTRRRVFGVSATLAQTLVCSIQDISERIQELKNAELELEKSEDSLQAALCKLGTMRDSTEQCNAVAALEVQSRVFEQIATGHSLTASLEEIASFVEQLIPESMCYILSKEKYGGIPNNAASADVLELLKEITFRLDEDDCEGRNATWNRKCRIIEDISTVDRLQDFRDAIHVLNLRSYWSVPLFEVAQTRNSSPTLGVNSRLLAVGQLAIYRFFPGEPDEMARNAIETAARDRKSVV